MGGVGVGGGGGSLSLPIMSSNPFYPKPEQPDATRRAELETLLAAARQAMAPHEAIIQAARQSMAPLEAELAGIKKREEEAAEKKRVEECKVMRATIARYIRALKAHGERFEVYVNAREGPCRGAAYLSCDEADSAVEEDRNYAYTAWVCEVQVESLSESEGKAT